MQQKKATKPKKLPEAAMNEIKKSLEEAIAGIGRANIEKPEIKEYYIAYFDILGYEADLKKNPDNAQGILDRIYNVVDQAINNTTTVSGLIKKLFIEYEMQCKIFSDNVLLCVEAAGMTTEKMIMFLEFVKDLQGVALFQDFFVRGAITKGKIAINEHFIFGDGLIDVVRMEEGEPYPRIVIDKKVMTDMENEVLWEEDRKILQRLRDLFSIDLKEQTPDNIVEVVSRVPRIINRILIESHCIFEDMTEAKKILQEFQKEREFFNGMEDPELKDILGYYLTIQKYGELAVKVGECILRKKSSDYIDYFNKHTKNLIIREESPEVYYIHYLPLLRIKKEIDESIIALIETFLKEELGSVPISNVAEFFFDEQNCEKIQRTRFEKHKELIIKNIKEICNLQEFDTTNPKAIEKKRKLQDKYSWLKLYHNTFAEELGLSECKIKCTCKKDEVTGIGVLQKVE